jgi:ribonuclease HI
MTPAKEDVYVIVFDGGSHGNPGPAYGSYHIRPWRTPEGKITRLKLGRGTNNEAEYWTLQAAVRGLLSFLEGRNQDPADAAVEIRGDSQLVIRQLTGEWKAKNPRMKQLRDDTLALLKTIGSVKLVHHPREKSVAILGH